MTNNALSELKEFLDEKVVKYNTPVFLQTDPLSIPHRYTDPEDIAISGFLTSIISWGQRKTIIRNAERMMLLMDDAPAQFVREHSLSDLSGMQDFAHRTFNSNDLIYFVGSLKYLLAEFGSLQHAFSADSKSNHDMGSRISNFRSLFFHWKDPGRSSKHISDPSNNSAAKRICMFLRWMVRKDNNGCDFGIWDSFSPSDLECPLDVHSGRVARKLGILHRKQNDWKAVQELTANLRILDPADPVRYDYALFGLGVFEKF